MRLIGGALAIALFGAPLAIIAWSYAVPLGRGRKASDVASAFARVGDPARMRVMLESTLRDAIAIAFVFGAIFGAMITSFLR